jgi:multidrug efflux pump subunit AcrB
MSATIKHINISNVDIPVIFEEQKSLPILNLQLIFKNSGYIKDNQNLGLASLSARVLNEGTKKLGSVKFSEILDDNAITIHSAVGFETLTIELSSLKEKSNLAIKSLNELLQSPNLSENSLEKVKTLAIGSLKRKENDIEDELIPVAGGLSSVPLRQIASIEPSTEDGQLVRRNGIYTITVMSDLKRGENAMEITGKIQEKIKDIPLPQGVTLTYGGDQEQNNEQNPLIMGALAIAAVMILFILIAHFHRLSIALLIFGSMTFCVFGTAIGVLIQGVDFSMTCTLGIVSLMGIIVRNGIIMIDYAEELRETERMHVREAIWHSVSRRMRPIFLTSAAASMGVIPMILGKSGLWMPLGTVICYGTLITMIFLLTVLPVAYLLLFSGSTEKRKRVNALEKQ